MEFTHIAAIRFPLSVVRTKVLSYHAVGRGGRMKKNKQIAEAAPWKADSGKRMVEVETLTRAYGHEIFARLKGAGPIPFTPSWWDERLMEWSMGDESIKLQLFRFVDVLPLLRSPETIARHLREYFGEARD